jgi:hypothetical protein
MLSATSFKDELRSFPWPKSSAIRQHLTRWRDDYRAEEVWQKIRANSDSISAEEFIRAVVRARCDAAGLIHRINSYVRDRAHAISLHEAKTAKALASTQSLSEIADALDGAAKDFRVIGRAIDRDLDELPANVITRKDQAGSLTRRMFYLAVGTFLYEKCGRWMDTEVTALADIAFPGTESTIDQVRAARRPTTSGTRAQILKQTSH